jgi:hypothetical protein
MYISPPVTIQWYRPFRISPCFVQQLKSIQVARRGTREQATGCQLTIERVARGRKIQKDTGDSITNTILADARGGKANKW